MKKREKEVVSHQAYMHVEYLHSQGALHHVDVECRQMGCGSRFMKACAGARVLQAFDPELDSILVLLEVPDTSRE